MSYIYEPKESAVFIVPDSLREAINAALDDAIAKSPDAAPWRDNLYSHLVAFFDEHGYIPEFSLQRREGDGAL